MAQQMKNAGLFFGTFNPIHIGHLLIANYMVEFTDLDEVWFVVTPRSPFKAKQSLLDNNHRYQMVYEAIEAYPKLKVSNVEFDMPQPNYTIHTLLKLEEIYGESHRFSLIMGEDNLRSFHKWKNYDVILENHDIYVYPRVADQNEETELAKHPRVHFTDAPIVEVSSTFIRKQHAAGKNIRAMLPEGVWRYLDEMNFYRSGKK